MMADDPPLAILALQAIAPFRAIAIATGKPYQEIYDAINLIGSNERVGKRKRGISNARTGVYPQAVRRYMLSIGWQWTPTMQIGC